MGVSGALIATLIGTTAATVGTGIYEAVSQPSAPTAPTSATTAQQQAQASQAAALAQADALTKRRGLASTILTSPTGVAGAPNVQKATLGA
jgi:hypothetical protein